MLYAQEHQDDALESWLYDNSRCMIAVPIRGLLSVCILFDIGTSEQGRCGCMT